MLRYVLVLLALTAFIPPGISEEASCINDNFDFQKASEETSTYPVVYNGCVDTGAPEMQAIVFQVQYDDTSESSSGSSFNFDASQCSGSGMDLSCSATSVEFEYTEYRSRGDDDKHFKIRVTDGKIPEESNQDVDVSIDMMGLQETTNAGFAGGITAQDLQDVCSGDSSGRLDPSNFNCLSDDSYAHGVTTTVLDDGERNTDSTDESGDDSSSTGDSDSESQETSGQQEPERPFVEISQDYPRSNQEFDITVGVQNSTANLGYDIILKEINGSSEILAQDISSTEKTVSVSKFVSEDSRAFEVILEYNYGAINNIMGMIPGNYDVLTFHTQEFKVYEQIPVWQRYCINNAGYNVSGPDLKLSDKTSCISNEIVPACFSESGTCSDEATLASYSVCSDVLDMTYRASEQACVTSPSSR